MPVRVGIPQALLYYDHFPAWRAFLTGLGCEVVRSGQTTEKTLRKGVELGENELCLPVKTFFGHIDELDGEVDYLFVPRVVSVRPRTYTCPKLLGLPDMVRAQGVTSELLAPIVDMRQGWRHLAHQAVMTGERLGATRAASLKALLAGLREYRRHEHRLRSGELLRLQRRSPQGAEGGGRHRGPEPEGRPLRIAVAGHPYNIYDGHTSQQILRRLAERGVEVFTPDMLHPHEIRKGVRGLSKPLFWSCEERLVGAVRHWVDHGLVDGVIYMLSFACGPDSFIEVLIEDSVAAAESGEVPLLSLVMDEHGGEAGFVTRLEAFVDMLARHTGRPVFAEGA